MTPQPAGLSDALVSSDTLASVVVPAHNEEAVIGRCLKSLTADLPAGALEVVVVCNGCTDRTAEIARTFGVRVVESGQANKSAALNLGDAAVAAFPRFYLDADIEVTGLALQEVAEFLRAGDALAAAPRLRPCMTQVPRPVRDYYRIWMRLPYVVNGHVGSGVIGLSEAGRRRFDRFPAIIADDLFLYRLFAPGERATVDSVHFTVFPARTTRDFIRRKIRVYAGNLEIRRLGQLPAAAAGSEASWLSVIVADPRLLTAAPAYFVISTVAKLLGMRKVRRGDLRSWERDDSSRTVFQENA
ncbi:glycosyltransferase family 2 protein [Frankia sp. Cpl3]|nr:glycosyltransferase family 2 protein [Frankia sp. Cpl3]